MVCLLCKILYSPRQGRVFGINGYKIASAYGGKSMYQWKCWGQTVMVLLVVSFFSGCSHRGGVPGTVSLTSHQQGHSENGGTDTSGVDDPAVQAVLQSGKVSASPESIEKLLQKKTFYFDFNSDDIRTEDFTALAIQAAYLNSLEAKNIEVIIQGNTDERGTQTYNISLGLRRADAVMKFLILHGVNAHRVRTISYGAENPENPEHNPIAWAKNRRAYVAYRLQEDHETH